MPDIFLSYAREDKATALRFAEALEREGLSVWWDATLNPGEAFDEVTEKALVEAKAVVVLWSKHSVASRWVRSEATQAHENKTLVPVMIESCKRPIMFELTHTSDLSHWNGDPNDGEWQSYLAGVRRFVHRDAPVGATPPALLPVTHAKNSGLWITIAALAALLIGGAVLWAINRNRESAPTQVAGAAAPAQLVTLAVLPFVNLSSDPEQEYFSDGLTEEVLNQLAQVKDLRVTARTSSFSFKGKNEDVRVIGEKLGVDNLLEGSIRKDGKTLRITAQLVTSKDGAHLWSQTYDRELSGVFALQEEIAKDVARALKIRLDVGDMTRAQGGTTNIEAYDKYLRAEAFMRVDGPEAITQGAQHFREAVALDPAFSRAWYRLYFSLLGMRGWAVGDPETVGKELAAASDRVVALAPDAWWTKNLQVVQLISQHKWLEATTALEVNGDLSRFAMTGGCSLGLYLGRINDSIPCFERLREADPLNMTLSVTMQEVYDFAGRPADARKEYERSKTLEGDHARANHWELFRLMASDATPEAIKAQFRVFMQSEESIHTQVNHELVEHPDDKAAALAAIRRALDDPAIQKTNGMIVVATYADRYDDKDLALEALSRYRIDLGLNPRLLWMHFKTNLRADPRFKEILRKNGFVDYFRASGKWGDFCKPVGTDDFECH